MKILAALLYAFAAFCFYGISRALSDEPQDSWTDVLVGIAWPIFALCLIAFLIDSKFNGGK